MAVTEVTAFQTTNGQCFSDKRQAYQQDLVELFQGLQVIKNKSYKLKEIDNVIADVADWLEKVRALRAQMDAETDDEVAKDLAHRV